MSSQFDIRIEWLDAAGVSTPELAATWARFEIWVDGSCVTQVEAADGTYRRSVYGSVYPLAEWVASNWWVLGHHVRPSAVDSGFLSWPYLRKFPWLRFHNLRGAGDGMSWPNMTIVPEGAVSRVTWAPDSRHTLASLRFAAAGVTILRSDTVAESLAALVDRVLDRLSENGLSNTRLAEEWSALARIDQEEREFCEAVARLGLDPFNLDESVADDVIRISVALPAGLVTDFFNTANVTALDEAASWAQRALTLGQDVALRAQENVSALRNAAALDSSDGVASIDRPWDVGYAAARRIRQSLNLSPAQRFDTSPWVASKHFEAPSGGIQGLVAVYQDKCGLVVGGASAGVPAARFKQAQAIGRNIASPDQGSYLLSAARGYDEKFARAFAAELLAPAQGIREMLGSPNDDIDVALEAAAQRFNVSALLVKHQYENQLVELS